MKVTDINAAYDPQFVKVSDTPRTNFIAQESGDHEWNRSINRFGRMQSHACILERELAETKKDAERYRNCSCRLGG